MASVGHGFCVASVGHVFFVASVGHGFCVASVGHGFCVASVLHGFYTVCCVRCQAMPPMSAVNVGRRCWPLILAVDVGLAPDTGHDVCCKFLKYRVGHLGHLASICFKYI